MMQVETIQKGGFFYEINKIDHSASIVGISRSTKNIVIPTFIQFNFEKYMITKIQSNSFKDNHEIELISFEDDSQIKSIEKKSFQNSSITKIILPNNIQSLAEGWIRFCPKLVNISILKNNQSFSYIDDTFLVQKKNGDKVQLIYVRRDIDEAVMPSEVTRICNSSFSYCQNLWSVSFKDDSRLTSIAESAFESSSVRSLLIPDLVETIEEGWCNDCPNLVDVLLSSNNEHFIYVDNSLLLQKVKDPNRQRIHLLFAARSLIDIEIPFKITRICNSAFSYCEHLKSVIFTEGSQLESIGEYAFFNSSIETIKMPASVTTIEKGAFEWCQNLALVDFELDSKLESIGNYAFYQSALTNIVIPSQVDKIGKYAFSCCKYLKSFSFQDHSQITVIDDYCFDRSSITSLTIPKSIAKIGKFAFFACKKLGNIELDPNSDLEIIEESTFEKSAIVSIEIPLNIKIIGKAAFCGCKRLGTIEIPYESQLLEIKESAFASSSIKRIYLPLSLQRISKSAFAWCSFLRFISFPEDSELTTIEESIFDNCLLRHLNLPNSITKMKEGWCIGATALAKFSIPATNPHFAYIDDTYLIQAKDNDESILLFARRDLTNATIPSHITRIGTAAFSFCTRLSSVDFHEESKLKFIGSLSFENSALTQIDIPTTVEEIQESAFRMCDKLSIVIFTEHSQLKLISNSAFQNTVLETISIPQTTNKIGFCSFCGCKKLKSITFDEDSELKIIEESAFKHSGLETISLPKSLEVIGNSAFFECKSLQSVRFPQDSELIEIGESTFYGTNLQSISIPSSVETINSSGFANCKNFQRIEFQQDSELVTIGKGAFSNTLLESICFPSKVSDLQEGWHNGAIHLTNIFVAPGKGSLSFIDDTFLVLTNDDDDAVLLYTNQTVDKITLPSSITRICSTSFLNCGSLTSIKTLNDSQLKIIDDYSFKQSTLVKIHIPNQVERIGKEAFSFCNNVQYVIFENKSKLKVIDESAFQKSSIKYITIPSSIISIKQYAFYSCNNLHSVTFSNIQFSNLKEIEELAFACSAIVDIEIPDNVEIIGKASFMGCDNLKTVKFSKFSKLHLIDESAFEKSSIKTIAIPPQVERIAKYSFHYCQQLDSLAFDEKSTLHYIDEEAFYETAIVSLVIPSQVRRIGKSAFFRCDELISVSFENKSQIDYFGDYAFANCFSLEYITIPESVKYIGSYCFTGTDLISVDFLCDEVHIGECCFDQCERLSRLYFPFAERIDFAEGDFSFNIFVNPETQITGDGSESLETSLRYFNHSKIHNQEMADLREKLKQTEERLSHYESVNPYEQPIEVMNDDDISKHFNKIHFIDDNDERDQKIVKVLCNKSNSIIFKILNQSSSLLCKKIFKIKAGTHKVQNLQFIMKEFASLSSIDHPSICKLIGVNMKEKMPTDEMIQQYEDENNDIISSSDSEGNSSDDDEGDFHFESNAINSSASKSQTNSILYSIAIFSEYLPYELTECIRNRIFDWTLKTRIVVEVAYGLSYMHSRNLLHTRLNSTKILLNGVYEAKIIDFHHNLRIGLNDFNPENCPRTREEIVYSSPEVLRNLIPDEKADVYSFGMLLYFIFFESVPNQEVCDIIKGKPIPFRFHSKSQYKNCIHLIEKCTKYDSKERPCMNEILSLMGKYDYQLAPEVDSKIINRRIKELLTPSKYNNSI